MLKKIFLLSAILLIANNVFAYEVPKNEEHMIFENDSIIPFLEHIWEEYGKFDADQLEYMTHHELPWQNARKGMSALDYSNKEISKKDIFIYFNNLAHE